MLFQKTQDNSFWMCVKYRALNKVTIKNKYLIPLATKLFDRLSKVEYFSKLDSRSRYWQVCVAEGDEGQDYMCDEVWKLRVLSHALWIDYCPYAIF